MAAIDIAYYPHIFDLIYEFADPYALARLCCTCRALRDKVHKEWEHLEWNVPHEGPDAVFTRRGVLMPTNSHWLRCTKMIDIRDEHDERDSQENLTINDCGVEVIRLLSRFGENLIYAPTIIVYNPGDVRDVQLDHHWRWDLKTSIIYRLDYTPATEGWCMFDSIGACVGPIDIYLVVTGCNPTNPLIPALCRWIMFSLRDQRFEHQMKFYFVDVRSWFDTSATTVPPGDSLRLDTVFSVRASFLDFMLECAETWIEDDEPEGSEWPTPEVLDHLSQIHRISKEGMRRRVGDNAYGLTYAPANLFSQE